MANGVVVKRAKNLFYIDLPGEDKPVLKYRVEGDRMFLESTYTPPMLRGKGYAASLVDAAIRYAEEDGLKIVPLYSYVVYYFTRHPEKKDLLDETCRNIIRE